MTRTPLAAGLAMLFTLEVTAADETTREEWLVRDPLTSPPTAPWEWVRPFPNGHRSDEKGLHVRVLPGNLWGPANDARNTLVRPAPEIASGGLEIEVTVSHRPTSQYEQVNLVWYYDDSHMVKLGLELVDGKTCIVMGREVADKTQGLAILPVETETVRLRLAVRDSVIVGSYQLPGSSEWKKAGEGPLPQPEADDKPARTGLQFYQGPADSEHWATVSHFTIRRVP